MSDAPERALDQALASFKRAHATSPALEDQARDELLLVLAAEVVALRAELERLRGTLDPVPARARPPARSSFPPQVRSLAYWAENVPNFDDDVDEVAEARALLHQPRVRPEDITLTAKELARATRPARPAVLSRAAKLTLLVGMAVVVIGLLLPGGVVTTFLEPLLVILVIVGVTLAGLMSFWSGRRG